MDAVPGRDLRQLDGRADALHEAAQILVELLLKQDEGDLRPVALEDCGFEPGSFDAVSLFDVLEHLIDPAATLRACARLLRPGGIVFLYVPNYDSASRLLMGQAAHFIWPTHHLNYYTPATARDLLARHGLDAAYVATEGLDIVDYLWYRREVLGKSDDGVEEIADQLQFFVNAGAYGKNLRVIGRKLQ